MPRLPSLAFSTNEDEKVGSLDINSTPLNVSHADNELLLMDDDPVMDPQFSEPLDVVIHATEQNVMMETDRNDLLHMISQVTKDKPNHSSSHDMQFSTMKTEPELRSSSSLPSRTHISLSKAPTLKTFQLATPSRCTPQEPPELWLLRFVIHLSRIMSSTSLDQTPRTDGVQTENENDVAKNPPYIVLQSPTTPPLSFQNTLPPPAFRALFGKPEPNKLSEWEEFCCYFGGWDLLGMELQDDLILAVNSARTCNVIDTRSDTPQLLNASRHVRSFQQQCVSEWIISLCYNLIQTSTSEVESLERAIQQVFSLNLSQTAVTEFLRTKILWETENVYDSGALLLSSKLSKLDQLVEETNALEAEIRAQEERLIRTIDNFMVCPHLPDIKKETLKSPKQRTLASVAVSLSPTSATLSPSTPLSPSPSIPSVPRKANQRKQKTAIKEPKPPKPPKLKSSRPKPSKPTSNTRRRKRVLSDESDAELVTSSAESDTEPLGLFDGSVATDTDMTPKHSDVVEFIPVPILSRLQSGSRSVSTTTKTIDLPALTTKQPRARKTRKLQTITKLPPFAPIQSEDDGYATFLAQSDPTARKDRTLQRLLLDLTSPLTSPLSSPQAKKIRRIPTKKQRLSGGFIGSPASDTTSPSISMPHASNLTRPSAPAEAPSPSSPAPDPVLGLEPRNVPADLSDSSILPPLRRNISRAISTLFEQQKTTQAPEHVPVPRMLKKTLDPFVALRHRKTFMIPPNPSSVVSTPAPIVHPTNTSTNITKIEEGKGNPTTPTNPLRRTRDINMMNPPP